MFFVDHLYFFWALFIFIVLWMSLFILNKEGRKWMLYMSLFGVIMGMPFVQNMYIADWWQPNFIFEFPIKIEDLLFGLGTVGVISSIYSLLKSKDEKLSQVRLSIGYKIFGILSAFFVLFSLFYLFNVHSLWASVIGVSVGVIFIAIKKPTFLKHAALTSLFICIYFLPMYLMAVYINPEFINNEWLLGQLSGVAFLSVPIEEFIWYIFTAFAISGLQEMLE